MLLDDDPAALIHQCIGNFNIAPDRSALTRIDESLTTLSQSRDLRLQGASSSLKRLSRQLQNLEQQHTLNTSSHNPTDHAAQILALDTQKFKVAKEASDLEIEGERLESELSGLEAQLKDLEKQNSQKEVSPDDEQEISLGVELEGEREGDFKRAVIRSSPRGDAKIIDIDPKFSKNYYVNQFWQAM
ncbi:MAG: kinetochore-associated Ndc80 complex subunit spc24 [Alyxoria varia]|nr:MAG: kinetochore-associated Ndc80 complex subunit spc24 [Alyxoria varia]